MKSYLDLLNLLLSFGPKLKLVWPLLLQAWPLLLEIWGILKPETPGELAITQTTAKDASGHEIVCDVLPSAEELAAETAISQALTADGTQAAFDFKRLRDLFKLAQDSGMLTWLITLLTKAATGG